jgi:hypothetical protein
VSSSIAFSGVSCVACVCVCLVGWLCIQLTGWVFVSTYKSNLGCTFFPEGGENVVSGFCVGVRRSGSNCFCTAGHVMCNTHR